MPGVQCVICLASDTNSEDWSVLTGCGHVFHTHCVLQSLEHSKRCPQCRQEYKQHSSKKPAHSRIFFEFSDEPASQPQHDSGAAGGSGGGGGSGSGDLQQLAFLQGQLREKDRRIQQVSTQLTEQEDRLQRVEQELDMARNGLRDKDGRLQEKILELSREHKQVKVLANQVANLAAQLKAESARASLLTLASDHGLAGPALSAEVDKLVRLGLKAPNDFWERLMSERSQVIIANSNRHGREKVALERKQAMLQAEVTKLQEQVASLKRSLAAARQQPGAAGGPDLLLLEQPPPQQSSAQAGPSRHAIRRFSAGAGGLAAGSAATAAAASGEEDPLLQSYDLLNMRLGDLPATRPQQHQQQQPAAAMEDDEEDEIVLIDESEQQEQLGAEGGCCYSEIKSDAEEQEEQRRQQQQQGAVAASLQQRPLAAQPQQQQQQVPGAGSVLGKRPATQTSAGQRQCAANGGTSAGGSQAGLGGENCAGSSGRGAAPLLGAGPGRGALQHGPGRTFIRNTATASIGLDRGKYISSGPDGKGGVASAYHSGGTGGAGAAGGVRLSQKQIDVRAMQAGGGSKKARGGGGGGSSGSSDAAAALALRQNKALPITSFFSRAQQ